MSLPGVLSTNDYFEIFLKSRFPQRKIENLVAYKTAFYDEVKKSAELTGDVTYMPIQLDSPQGLGVTLGDAGYNGTQNVTSTTGGGSVYGQRAAITRARYYALLTLDAETMMAMESDEGGFFKARERNVTEVMEGLGQQIESSCWSAGTGSLGTVGGSDPSAGAVVTLANTADAIKFHIGMTVDFYSNSSGVPTTLRASDDPYKVLKINEDTGVLTIRPISDLTSGVIHAEVVVGDHLVRRGDVAGYLANRLIKGVPAWIPETAETTGTFFGLDRTVAVQKLQGHRQSWLGSIEETVKKLDSKIRRVSQTKPKTLWCSFSNFNRLDLELGARGYRMENGEEGKFGRPSLMMSTPGGGVRVTAAPYVPDTACWLLDMDTWKMCTLGKAPQLVQDDGNVALRIAAGTTTDDNSGDGIEIRWRYFAQLVCTMPYSNGVASIS